MCTVRPRAVFLSILFVVITCLAATSRASMDPCQPTGLVEVTVERGAIQHRCLPISQWRTCDDGSTRLQEMEACDEWQEVTTISTIEMAMPDGTPCPPRVVVERRLDHVGSYEYYIGGDVCEDSNECCDLIAEGWRYDTDPDWSETELEIDSEPFPDCPDGQMGTLLIVSTVTYERRRRVDYEDWEPSFDAPDQCEDEPCEDVEEFGDWERVEVARTSYYTVLCPDEPERP